MDIPPNEQEGWFGKTLPKGQGKCGVAGEDEDNEDDEEDEDFEEAEAAEEMEEAEGAGSRAGYKAPLSVSS